MQTSAWLILLFPLAGTIVIGLGYRALPARVVGLIGTAAIAAAFAAAIATFIALQGRGEEEKQVVYVAWDYANTVGVDGKISILIDPLSVFMTLVVTGVSMLIHLYSVAYLTGDRGYARFFAYLNFFVFSMLVLVMAGNFLLLIIGWAFVGAASYLLISFWYRRTTAGSSWAPSSSSATRARWTSWAPSTRHRRTSPGTAGRSPPGSSCCSSAPSRSRPRSRCTPGSRTPWRARHRSPP
jgi:NADH-quinone oxidoreductase subunit L